MPEPTKEKLKYDQVFIENFSIEANDLGEQIAFNKIRAWDSIGHMTMIAALESEFGITLDTDDITGFDSYTKGFEILAKYGIHLDPKGS